MTAAQLALRGARLSAMWRILSNEPPTVDVSLAVELCDELHTELLENVEQIEVSSEAETRTMTSDRALAIVRRAGRL